MSGPYTDVLTPEQRSRCMSHIHGRDTKPEMLVRRALFARGYRFRLHDARLPGRPDLVFPGRRAVIFVHGCFWHAHDCALFTLPSTRSDFWEQKLRANRERDGFALTALNSQGWRALVIWECALKGRARLTIGAVTTQSENFLNNPECLMAEIQGSTGVVA